MDITNKYKRVALSQIVVDRDERQRSEIDVNNIIDSIERHGVLNPIIVTRDLRLIAGERRLEASRQLGLFDIPVRFIDDCTEVEMQIIELEENLKRSDLPWQDQVRALDNLHRLFGLADANWTMQRTAESIGISPQYFSQAMRVARDIDNPRIAAATGTSVAYNILLRQDERRAGDAISEIIEAGTTVFEGGTVRPMPLNPLIPQIMPTTKPTAKQDDLLCEDFLTWAPLYDGERFNFIHCDFPFGIGVFEGKLSGRERWTPGTRPYDDHEDIYWELLKTLCNNLDRLMSVNGHLMFWFSMEHYARTIRLFEQLAPSLEVQPFPLVWVKSDNVGILPDPKRGPRRIYETALIASRDDRLIVKAVSNAYNAPTDKSLHPSTKPEPMLRHFMQMFVDEGTKMLDPTCGSGSSLRAAESLGARRVLGLELDPEHFEGARMALRKFRALRSATA